MLQGLNWIGVIAALAASQVMSFVWYGVLFAKRLTEPLSPQMKTPAGYAEAAAFSLIMLVGLAWVIRRTNRDNLVGGVMTGAAIWFFFPFMGECMNWLYLGRDVDMVVIDSGYSLLFMVVGGALIGGVKLGARRGA
jgi:hypothetical protein